MAEIERFHEKDSVVATDRLQRVVELLRFSRLRLTALRLRIYGGSPAFGELLLCRALGDAGYAAQLRGGDAVFLYIGNGNAARPQKIFDAAVEATLIERLSKTLAEMTWSGPRIRVLVSTAHVWSDAVGDPDELVSLVTRMAPKTDITVPVHQCDTDRWAASAVRAAV